MQGVARRLSVLHIVSFVEKAHPISERSPLHTHSQRPRYVALLHCFALSGLCPDETEFIELLHRSGGRVRGQRSVHLWYGWCSDEEIDMHVWRNVQV
jgi:hypothetical protein